MNKVNNSNSKGFTIIEVVLVLAIAGLIFLVVFLALPALQRSQRDNQRHSDVSRAMSQIAAYQSNHQGSVPTSQAELVTAANSFLNSYMVNGNQQFKDPFTGNNYNLQYQASIATLPTGTGDLFYYQNAVCSGTGLAAGSGSRNVAFMVKTEQGGTYCVNN